MTDEKLKAAAEKYAQETQVKLNERFPNMVPAWGPLAGAFDAGAAYAREEILRLLRSEPAISMMDEFSRGWAKWLEQEFKK